MIHLIKLCVGVDSVEELQHWQVKRAAERTRKRIDPRPRHCTRNMPRRHAEVVDGGSLYWVIRHQIQARQRIVEINRITDDDGRPMAELVFDPELIPTRPTPRRPFQGWRYLKAGDAPPDLTSSGGGLEEFPAAIRVTLADLGVR